MKVDTRFYTPTGGAKRGPLFKMSWPLAADAYLRGLCASRAARPR